MNAVVGSQMDRDFHQKRFETLGLELAIHNVLSQDPELERTPEGEAELQRLLAEFEAERQRLAWQQDVAW